MKTNQSISRRLVLQGITAAATIKLSGGLAFASQNENHKVTIKGFSFEPSVLKIKSGDTVEWRNLDGFLHSATSDHAQIFDTGLIRTGQSATHTFRDYAETTEIAYHCDVYPKIKGKIIVE